MNKKEVHCYASYLLATHTLELAPDLELSWKPADKTSLLAACGKFMNRMSSLFPLYDWTAETEEPSSIIEMFENDIPIEVLGYDPWDGDDRFYNYQETDPYRMFLLLVEVNHLYLDEGTFLKAKDLLHTEWGLETHFSVDRMHVSLNKLLQSGDDTWMGDVPVEREQWQGMLHLCQWLMASTGYGILDTSMSEQSQGGGDWEWSSENIADLAEHWAVAGPVYDSIWTFMNDFARKNAQTAVAMVKQLFTVMEQMKDEDGDEEE